MKRAPACVHLKRLKSLRALVRTYGRKGQWDWSPHMLGHYNGLEAALAVLEDRPSSPRSPPAQYGRHKAAGPQVDRDAVCAAQGRVRLVLTERPEPGGGFAIEPGPGGRGVIHWMEPFKPKRARAAGRR